MGKLHDHFRRYQEGVIDYDEYIVGAYDAVCLTCPLHLTNCTGEDESIEMCFECEIRDEIKAENGE